MIKVDKKNYPILFNEKLLNNFLKNAYPNFLKNLPLLYSQVESQQERKDCFKKHWDSIEKNLDFKDNFEVDFMSNSFVELKEDEEKKLYKGLSKASLHTLFGNCAGFMLIGDYVVRYSIVKEASFFQVFHRLKKVFSFDTIFLNTQTPSFKEFFTLEEQEPSCYLDYQKIVFKCIIALLFKKSGLVEVVKAKGGKKIAISNTEELSNKATFTVNYLDSSWLRTIVRSEGFLVRSFFRWQPCGVGRQDRKLIFIESFMKHGYIRRAGKLVYEEKSSTAA